MKPKEFQELLDFIAKSGLAEVSIETELFKVAVKRDSTPTVTLPQYQNLPATLPSAVSQAAATSLASSLTTKSKDESKTAGPDDKYITIKSPMIGTFYRSASPDSDSFVNVGDSISTGQTVCIIEAMKLFNEIESEISGKIIKILVENATPIEYDQPLFLVDPS